MLELDPGMMIWTWLTFGIVLLILYKVALKPILAAIESREESIKQDIEVARKQRDEAEELLGKHQQMLEQAESEGQKILKENQELARKTRETIIEEARGEASQMVEKAKKEIDQQKDSAVTALKAEVADMAIAAAEKILSQALDAEKHKKVVDDYIDSMPGKN